MTMQHALDNSSLRVRDLRTNSLTTSQLVNHSHISLTSIQEEIVRLSSTERAMLIDILW